MLTKNNADKIYNKSQPLYKINFMKSIETAKMWLSDTFDAETRNKVQALIDGNPDELNEAFHKNLEFGTGGMRGIMGIGTNRINKYTLGKNSGYRSRLSQ